MYRPKPVLKKPVIKKPGYRRKGTHGSLSKAGKMQELHGFSRKWRKIKKKSKGNIVTRKFKGKKKLIPRVKNRRKYHNRIILEGVKK